MSKPQHIAIIMDGNGRWATRRGLPRVYGHRRGVEALRSTVRAVGERHIPFLTLFAFSSENWRRPEEEVGELMGLLKRFIRRDLAELHAERVRVKVIGARNNLEPDILALLEEAETLTRENDRMTLVVAFNYGARDELTRAVRTIAQRVADGEIAADDVCEMMVADHLDTSGVPNPDLIIRTSGELRLSNFLLWQAAYSEFVFSPCAWPDFDAAELDSAIAEFSGRQRRYGGIAQERAIAS